MAQIGQILLEYTKWLQEEGMNVPIGEVSQVALVEAFLQNIEQRQWMPTTGADPEEAEPDPVDDDEFTVNIKDVVQYAEGIALNEAANTSARLKAAEVVMRWYDVAVYADGLESEAQPRTGPPWPFMSSPRGD